MSHGVPARRLRVCRGLAYQGGRRVPRHLVPATAPRAASASASWMRAVRAHGAPRAAVPPRRGGRATGVPSAPRPRTGPLGPEVPGPVPSSKPSLATDRPRSTCPASMYCNGEILVERVPDHARCPCHGIGLLHPRECVADVAEVAPGRGIRGRGHPLRLRRTPRSWRRRWLVRAASTLAAKWPCRFRYCDWALRARPAPRSGSRRRTRRPAGSPPRAPIVSSVWKEHWANAE